MCSHPTAKSSIFKVPLETLWDRHDGEPVFFQIAIAYLRRRGLGCHRIFRDHPVDQEEYQQFVALCEAGNSNQVQHQNAEYRPSPVIVGEFLRFFLLNLPTPLIPNRSLLDAVDGKIPDVFKQPNPVQIGDIDPSVGILDQLSYIKSMIMSLKPEQYHILSAMVSLFHDICSHQKDDGFESLDAHHIAQIFGPIFVGLKHSQTPKALRLSQDLVLFLLENFHDIFERNTFKELLFIRRSNRDLQRVQKEQSQSIRELRRVQKVLSDKLAVNHFESRLKSRLFLAWSAEIPRTKSERKQYVKLQSLSESLDISEQIIERQSKRIRALETKLELDTFGRRLSTASALNLTHILGKQTRRNSSHIVGGSMVDDHEYLRRSIAEIVDAQRFDEVLTRDSSYKQLTF